MLGIGNIVTAGSKVANVVRRGLQAWYKADDTQAPLGEEKIVNGNFSLGPELVTNGSFTGIADGTDSILVDGAAEGWRAYGTPVSRNIVNEQLVIVQDVDEGNDGVRYDISGVTAGETYKIQFDTLQGAAGSSVYSNNPNATLNVSSATPENPTKTFYKTIEDNGSFSVYFRGPNNGIGTAIYDNISIKKANPNDSWQNNDNVTFQDGLAKLFRNTGVNGGFRQDGVFVVGKNYEITYEIVTTQTNGFYISQHGGGVSLEKSVGVHTFKFTPGTGITYLQFVRNSADDGPSIDFKSISVKEITNSVKDFSPNSNDAVLYSGTALDFDGDATNPDYIALDYPPASAAISASSKYTIACWFNAATLGQFMVFSNGQDGNNRLYLWTSSSKLYFNWGDKIGTVATGSIPDVVADKWYRFVAVLDGLTAYVYLDGELQYTKVSSSAFNLEDNINIGRHGDSDTFPYDGMVSDFQVYDACWNASDVTYDYNNPDKDVFDNSTSSILPTNCKTLLRLNEGAGTKLYDAAPVLGANLITNGSFSSNSGWTTGNGTGWSIVDGAAVSNSSGGDYIFKNVGLTQGRLYEVSYDIVSYTSGQVRVEVSTNEHGQYRNSTGTYVEYLKPSSSTSNRPIFRDASGGGFVGSIDNVSVKEITLSDSFLYVDGDNDTAEWKTAQPYIPQLAMSSYSKKMVFTDIDTDVDVGAQSIADNQAFSFSFWYAQTDDSSLENYILAKHDSADSYIRFNNQNESLAFKVDTKDAVSYNISDLTDFKISHIVLTRASGANPITKCYVNGILEVTDTSNNAGGVFEYQQIGAGGTSNAGTFFLDELAHFDKELSSTEVQEIFNAGTALDCRDHSCYYSDNLITNSTFDVQSPWGFPAGGGVTLKSGGVELNNLDDGTNNVYINYNSIGVVGEYYKLSYDVLETNGVDLVIEGSGSNVTLDTSTTGVNKSIIYQWTKTGLNLVIKRNFPNAIRVILDNIKLQKVDLAGYWRNNGTDAWTDLSPYGNNGTVNGSPTTIKLQEVPQFNRDSFGLPMNKVRQRGLNFDGDSYVKVDDDSSLSTMDDGFTCAFWYRHAETIDASNYSFLVAKGTGLGTNVDSGFAVSVFDNTGAGGRIYADLNTNTTPNGRFNIVHTIGAATSSSPVWYYITATYNGSDEFELYVDATSRGTASVTGSVSATAEAYPITIGTDKNYYSGEARAVVDEVKWYNRALTQAEINRNYRASKSKHSSTSNWSDDFDENFV